MAHTDRGRQSAGSGLDSWSVRVDARSPYTERVFQDMLRGCADLIGRQFPPGSGYEIQRVHLSGPVEGTSFRIRRGAFAATASVQCFGSPARGGDDPAGPTNPDAFELRLVARSHSVTTALVHTPHRTGLRLTGGAAASLGVGALALAISGSLTAWATAVLLIPALFAARLCMTLWLADALRRRASAAGALPEATRTAAQARDGRRWDGVLEGLDQLHEDASGRLMLRPFRGLSSATTPLALRPALRSAG